MRFSRPHFVGAFFALALSAPLHAQYDDTSNALREPSAASTLDQELADSVAAHLGFLASDELGGRETGTLEGDITARYVEAQFRRLGLQPAGDKGGYLQSYPLLRARLLTEECRLALIDSDTTEFNLRDDFAVSGTSDVGVDADFALAWAGWGLVDEALGVDSYADLDVTGRLVLMYSGAPSDRSDLLAGSRSTQKAELARERGAAGVVFVMPEGNPYSGRMMDYFARRMGRSSLGLDRSEAGTDVAAAPRVYVSESVARTVFASAHVDWDELHAEAAGSVGEGGGFLLDGPRLHLTAKEEVERFEAANVIGLLPGRNPELAHEVLVLSAHMDHEGRSDDGEVFNGADDNASGTTAVMVAAERLARDPTGLDRSVMFLCVSGEEKGLLGSEYFVGHSTVPLENIVGNINIDMVGRNGPASIGATPSPEHPAHNTLAARSVEVGERVGLQVEWEAGEGKYRKRVDTYYSRSDHMHFSQAGIPVVFFFSGEHDDYHRVSDTLEKINQGKVRKVVQMVELLTRDVAADPAKPAEVDA
ncbi:MAG: aminopeptidase [Planctomycetota bacterium]|nr:MAG: aminopeptidase [Planctomycetota bacterium]